MRREADIESERERMRKTQGKQIEIKTNKEYTALLQEIEGVKDAIDRLETEILEMIEKGFYGAAKAFVFTSIIAAVIAAIIITVGVFVFAVVVFVKIIVMFLMIFIFVIV